MRSLIWIAASAALAASCGKQLNPEYCAAHPNDVDCQNAGEVVIDAPAPCTSNAMCATGVCDTKLGQCEECTPAMNVCTGTMVCDVDDHCHACTASMPQACGAMGVCLPDDTCASTSSFLYATPTPGPAPDCSMMKPCDLGTAIGKLDAGHRVISLAATTSTHYTGGQTINADAVIFGDAARGVTMGPDGAVIDGSLAVASAVTVALDNLSITNSAGAGLQCSAGTVTFHYAKSYNNAGLGIDASNACTLNIDRAWIYSNTAGGLQADASAVNVTNVFVYGNSDGPAVRLSGGVTGSFTYSSIGYNDVKKNTDAASCQGTASFAFNIVAGDNLGSDGGDEGNGTEFSNNGCSTNQNIVNNSASGLFSSSTDLHLPQGSQAIDQVAPTECIQNDIDGEARPKGTNCDIGADEY